MVFFVLFVSGVVGVSIFLWFGYERLEDVSNQKGWVFLKRISRIIFLSWIVSYSLVSEANELVKSATQRVAEPFI
jgi:hypothetical protein